MKKLTAFAPQILGLTRILVGILFTCHGAQKVLGAFGGVPPGSPALIVWVAGLIELIGGVMLAVGLFTRSVAFLSSGLMAVAYFMAHAPQGFWPIKNGGELAVVYCWLFLCMAALGPGAFALDNLRGGASGREPAVA
ncbi:MAG TPA: DoxX family protein [Vicinamibacteria bacterium]